jgi:hypothetical protein
MALYSHQLADWNPNQNQWVYAETGSEQAAGNPAQQPGYFSWYSYGSIGYAKTRDRLVQCAGWHRSNQILSVRSEGILH